jgi:formimidoylglutamate deiminase
VSAATKSTGETLLRGAVASGVRGTGRDGSKDVIVLDDRAPQHAGATQETLIDRFVFSGNRNLVREVRVDGRPVVTEGRHEKREMTETRFRTAIAALLDD